MFSMNKKQTYSTAKTQSRFNLQCFIQRQHWEASLMTAIFLVFAGTSTCWQSEAQNGYWGLKTTQAQHCWNWKLKVKGHLWGWGRDRRQMRPSLSGDPSTAALPPPHRTVTKPNHTPLLKKKPQKPNKMKNKNHKIKTNTVQRPQGQGEWSAGN